MQYFAVRSRCPDHGAAAAAGANPIKVHGALEASGLAPERLKLGVTETVLSRDTQSMVRLLAELRALDVRIARTRPDARVRTAAPASATCLPPSLPET